MIYRNVHGGSGTLQLTYESSRQQWHAKKSVDGIVADEIAVFGWKSFFVNLTAIGLLDGESCEPREDAP